MTETLARFQDDFLRSLWAANDDLAPHLRTLAVQPGFSVYRNTVVKGCIDALQDNFPAVLNLVGEEWFRAAAALHVRAQPPEDARLLRYGAQFPDFLRDFPPAADLPYLADVAQLDRFWTEAHAAGDADALTPTTLAALPLAQLGELALVPHPAARWAWYHNQPIYSLWRRNREEQGTNDDEEVAWCGEGALITRPAGQVNWTFIDAAGCAFLDACRAGQRLAQAAEGALESDPQVDLAQLMASLLEAGAFSTHNPAGSKP